MLPKLSHIVSFAAGAAVGAGIEYLLDPDSGKKRRDHYSTLLGEYASDMGDRTRDIGGKAYDRASHAADQARGWAMSTGHRARRRADRWLRHMHRNGHHDTGHQPHVGTMIGATLGALGLGAVLMYALDPQMGRRRRAMVRDQATGRWHDARDYVSHKARHAAGHLKGYAHEARAAFQPDNPTDEQLSERVRAQLGHFTTQAAGIEVAVQEGVVTLRGNVPESERMKIEEGIRAVRGVRNVENQLQTV